MSGKDFVECSFGWTASTILNGNESESGDLNSETIGTDDGIASGENENDEYIEIVNPDNIAYQSSITGVSVWGRSRLRYQRKKRRVPLHNALAEIEQSLEDDIEGNEEGDEGIDGIMHVCDKCGKAYRVHAYMERHLLACKGEKNSCSMLNRAARMAFSMLGTADAPLYTTKEGSKHLDIPVLDTVIEPVRLEMGWAQRPKHGETLGKNFVHKFGSEIEDWFNVGEQDNGKKTGASRMRELLRKKYPNRYDIPGEQSIISYISGLLRRKKAGKSGKNVLGVSKRVSNNFYWTQLKELLDASPDLMPRHAMPALINALNLDANCLPNDFPKEATIKSKLSSMRCQRSRSTENGTVLE